MFGKVARVTTITAGISSLMIGGMASAVAKPDVDDESGGYCASFGCFSYEEKTRTNNTPSGNSTQKYEWNSRVDSPDGDSYSSLDQEINTVTKDGEVHVYRYEHESVYGTDSATCTSTDRSVYANGELRNRKESSGCTYQ